MCLQVAGHLDKGSDLLRRTSWARSLNPSLVLRHLEPILLQSEVPAPRPLTGGPAAFGRWAMSGSLGTSLFVFCLSKPWGAA